MDFQLGTGIHLLTGIRKSDQWTNIVEPNSLDLPHPCDGLLSVSIFPHR